MEPELAIGFPAAGAIMASALRRNRRVALAAGAAMGLAGTAALLITSPGDLTSRLAPALSMPASARVLMFGTSGALGLVVVLAPRGVDRVTLLAAALAGLAGLVALAVVPDPGLLALVLLGLAAGHAALPGTRPAAVRLRGPALAALLLGLGFLLSFTPGPPATARLAALALAAGLAAAVGVLPFLQQLDPKEPVPASSLAWNAFFGPVLALAFTERVLPLLPGSAAAVYGALLIGMGLVNLGWGTIGAWATPDDAAAWRYSFVADWGLALVGFGLLLADGRAAAYLVLLSLVMVRLPLYFFARPVVLGFQAPALRPLNIGLAALLAGVAPFAGFVARLLLLRAATQLSWPLAVVLAACMLLWFGHSVRLARTLGRPSGRALVGVCAAVAASLAIGLLPGPLLAAGGL